MTYHDHCNTTIIGEYKEDLHFILNSIIYVSPIDIVEIYFSCIFR